MDSVEQPRTGSPLPPLELAHRVGSLAGLDDPFARYDELGRHARDSILELLGPDWSHRGKRILDFGCGAGRTLRHFTQEALECDFWGCDIDAGSIDWLQTALSPPFHVFRNGDLPPLEFESDSFDFVYAISVFTHLTDSWSRWLLELHRILAPQGLLLGTFIGPGAARHVTQEPWIEDRIGMNVLRPGQTWDLGGPMVLHSPWWIQSHWGRAFEILEIELDGFGALRPEGQGAVLMRKRMVKLKPEELEEPESDEPRELASLEANNRQLVDELTEVRGAYEQLAAAWKGERGKSVRLQERVNELEASLTQVAGSRSWRITAPLRALRHGLTPRWFHSAAEEGTSTDKTRNRRQNGNQNYGS